MKISAKNGKESMDVLFGNKDLLDTKTFFKNNGLIKEKNNSIFAQIKSVFSNKVSQAFFATLCITGTSYIALVDTSEAKTQQPKTKIQKVQQIDRGASRTRNTVKTHRALTSNSVYNNNTYSGRIVLPAKGMLTSGFGVRWNRAHKGIDIASKVGTDIVAAMNGTVSFVGWQSGFGKTVEITHSNGVTTRYAHCSDFVAEKDQEVTAGELIAKMGNTGRSTGPHLHFEVLVNGVQVNPRNYM